MVSTRSRVATLFCTVIVAGASSAAAFAGEVIGPPGHVGVIGSGSQTDTAAPAHANSICAFSGLNDFRANNGPIDFIVQSPGQDVRNGGPAGIPGQACHGGSNPENP